MIQAIVQASDEKLLRLPGSYRDPKEITKRLQYAARHYHLVSPATACGAVPEGCSISLSTVVVDVEQETYNVGGKRGLSKVALDKIAAAAGISWDPRLSGRIDDGSDPHYCVWRAVGRMRHLDGTEVQIVGTKEMDLRDGSQAVANESEKQIREKRLHIAAHAETKARLRAIRSIGIRPAYTPEELEKPFVVAKIMWTGETQDPELRRLFAIKQADAMIGGTRALYGEAPALSGASHAPSLPTSPISPPPVGSSAFFGDDENDFCTSPNTIDGPAAPPTPTPTQTQAAKPAAIATASARQPSGVVIKFGQAKGRPIEEASDRDLAWYAEALQKSVDDPDKARFRAANQRELDAVRAELAARKGGPTTGAKTPVSPPTDDHGADPIGDDF